MLKTVKAKINKKGELKLLEPLKVDREQVAIVTVLHDEIVLTDPKTKEMILLNEKSLAKDWNSKADSRWDSILI